MISGSVNEDLAYPNVDLRSLVKLALNQKVSWFGLKTFLHELTSTLETSKELNDVLLEELQILHSKTIKIQIQDTVNNTDAEVQEIAGNDIHNDEISDELVSTEYCS